MKSRLVVEPEPRISISTWQLVPERLSFKHKSCDVSVSARSSKLPVGERCAPVGEQSSQGVCLRMGTFPFANGLVCEKSSFLFTLPTLSHGFHRYPVIANGQVPVDERDSTQWQTEEY